MFKRFFLILLTLFFQLEFFVTPVAAIDSCTTSKIDWDPKTFEEGSSNFSINFTINDENTFNKLENNSVRILMDYTDTPAGKIGGTFSPAAGVNIGEAKSFSIPLTGDLTSKKTHSGVLQYLPSGASDYQDFCAVSYQVGISGSCVINTATKIPPNGQLTVQMRGTANSEYTLIAKKNTFIATSTITAKVTTGNDGVGTFSPINLPGVSGDSYNLTIKPTDLSQHSCTQDVQLDNTAAPQGPIGSAPALTPAVPNATPCIGSNCSSSGGEPCSDSRGPAIKTAIGCIHTNPIEFIKDFTTFIIAVSGGLAFLMMLLGAFQMVTSAGNPDSLNNGRQRLTSAVIGLLFVIFATLIMQVIGLNILQIPGFGK